MHGRDDDDEEWRERERAKLSINERFFGKAEETTFSGFKDRRSARRTLRLVPFFVRLHPRIKAMVDAIVERDGIPSLVVFFELMLEAYLKQHGPVDAAALPNDEELARVIEKGREKSDE